MVTILTIRTVVTGITNAIVNICVGHHKDVLFLSDLSTNLNFSTDFIKSR
jgi:hypothetical protein